MNQLARSLKALSQTRPLYVLPSDPLAEEVLIPGFKESSQVDCMVGFFSSGVLASLAPGLATYIAGSARSFRLLVSPFLRQEDHQAIEHGVKTRDQVAEELIGDVIISVDLLQQHTLKCLSWLLRAGRIEIKVALLKGALFHPKVWLFEDGQNSITVHGSSNVTYSGIMRNFEQVAIANSWTDANQKYIVEKLRFQFDRLWANKEENCMVIPIPQALRKRLIKDYHSENPPSEKEYKDLYSQAQKTNEVSEPIALPEFKGASFEIPSWLRYEDGPYEHQGKAVRAWCENDYQGILSIATGGGKTLTSLVAASLLSQKLDKLFVVIAVPTTALLNQWQSDVRSFSAEPINTLGSNAKTVKRQLKEAGRKLRLNLSKAEVLLITHDSLKSDHSIQIEILSRDIPTLLIGDEVHNLGSEGFKNSPPDYFKYRLGLSATYERAFDEDGNAFLLRYFGDVVFDYPLEKAIGNCLVPYEYYAHEVSLTAEEEEDFLDITYEIKKLSYASNFSDGDHTKERLKRLFLKRRRIIESASQKIDVFDQVLPLSKDAIQRTLIFCTDKFPEQLNEVNAVLNTRSLEFHQITQEETQNPNTLKRLVSSFSNGDLQALTSKRVLDEGFNVPQTEVAYLLASQTGKRQWIQRLGRILRLSPSTNKRIAVLHDLIVVPPSLGESFDEDFKSMVRSEYERVQFFTKLSQNGLEEGGSIYLINKLLNLMRKK